MLIVQHYQVKRLIATLHMHINPAVFPDQPPAGIIKGCVRKIVLYFRKLRIRKRCIIKTCFVVLFQYIFKIVPQLIFRADLRTIRPLGFSARQLIDKTLFDYGFQFCHDQLPYNSFFAESLYPASVRFLFLVIIDADKQKISAVMLQ